MVSWRFRTARPTEVQAASSGRSSPGRKGTISFYNDGTFEYQETGKGSGTGVWQASEGKLCEARNPTSFLPKGTPSVCTPISSDGTKFTTGRMQLIPS